MFTRFNASFFLALFIGLAASSAFAQNGSSKSTGLPKTLVIGYAFIDDDGSGSPTGVELPGITLVPNTVGVNFPLAPVGNKGALAGVNVTLSGGSLRGGTGRVVAADFTGEYSTTTFEFLGSVCNATMRAGLGVSTRSYLANPTSNLAVVGAGLNIWLAPERMALNIQGIGRYDLGEQDHFGQVSIGVLYRL
ncbi:MAG: hypothetical protein NWS18_04775 [Schleiferiaceae bacterium]|jgi:hypothetical protein|nr:hypothetical protein [Schleiferiaceae bacterium]MDP4626576.1 hypothetical protein [Schleiferiaceae bacterium]MDP4728657.1 hypothetical protein [Schleiferiaceae bacterium]MDP4749956.1 hypothetical protein [Schleiferiaceae bacterium]MDP4859054.1 hypothetical protein [Schleiferiaceae bacterium]